LDAITVVFFLSSPAEVGAAVASEATPVLVALLSAALLYTVFGPLLVGHLVGRWRTRQPAWAGPPRIPWIRFVGMIVLTSVLVSLSLLPGRGPTGASQTFARDDFVNVALSEVEGSPLPSVNAEKARDSMPTNTRLEPTEETRKRNVVLISLESTRARSVTPYNPQPGDDALPRRALER
ncbi:MAG: sulfatase, partial [Actinomycetota bacterium]|nr:sulfatase [Actinomycetota bacterium]